MKVVLPFLVFALLVVACSPEKKPAPQGTLRIAMAASPGAALAHVAVGGRLAERHGLSLEGRMHPTGMEALNAMLAGEADAATCSEFHVVQAAIRGEDFRVIASIAQSSKAQSIVARIDRGISNVADLRGKRIGVAPGLSGEYFLRSILLSAWMDQDDVVFVRMAQEDMTAGILAGKVDGVTIRTNVAERIAESLGGNGTLLQDDYCYTEIWNLVVRPAFLRERPQAVTTLLSSFIDAAERIDDDPSRALAMADGLKRDPVPPQKVVADFSPGIGLEQSLLIFLTEEARWVIERSGRTSAAIPDFLVVIDEKPLLSLRPDAVRMIR